MTRFGKIVDIDLSGIRLSTIECIDLLNHCLATPSIQELNLSGVDLSEVPEELIGKSVGQLRKVNLASLNHLVRDFWSTRLTPPQISRILKHSLQFNQLLYLNLEHVDLSQVPADLLAEALSRLQAVNLTTTNLSTNQCETFLTSAASSSTLQDVDLKCVDLQGVSPLVIAKAVCRLKKVNLGYTWLRREHFKAIFEASIKMNVLEDLTIFATNLASLPPLLLAQATGHLRKVDLTRTDLNTLQIVAILERSIEANTLENLDLQYVNLSEVPEELLARAIARLKQVTLTMTQLTRFQSQAIFNHLITSKTIRDFNMANIDLSEVSPPSLVAESVANLCGKVNLENTNLTAEQTESLFHQNLKAEDLSLWKVNLSKINSQVLAESVAALPKVNLGYSGLEIDQITPLLQQSLTSNTLFELYLSGVDLSLVPPKLLAKAISRLRFLIIWKNCLTPEQCTAIFEESLTSKTLVGINLLEVDLSQVKPVDLIGKAVAKLTKANLGKICLTPQQCSQLLYHCHNSISLITLRLDGADFSETPQDLVNKAKARFNI